MPDKEQEPTQKPVAVFLVHAPEDSDPVCEELATVEEAAARLRRLAAKAQAGDFAYVFRGERVKFTGGKFPYLTPEGEQPIPLFDPPAEAGEPLESGALVEYEEEEEAAEEPTAQQTATDAPEEFDEFEEY